MVKNFGLEALQTEFWGQNAESAVFLLLRQKLQRLCQGVLNHGGGPEHRATTKKQGIHHILIAQ